MYSIEKFGKNSKIMFTIHKKWYKLNNENKKI